MFNISLNGPAMWMAIAGAATAGLLYFSFGGQSSPGGGFFASALFHGYSSSIVLGFVVGFSLWIGLPELLTANNIVLLNLTPDEASHGIAIILAVLLGCAGLWKTYAYRRRRRHKRR